MTTNEQAVIDAAKQAIHCRNYRRAWELREALRALASALWALDKSVKPE